MASKEQIEAALRQARAVAEATRPVLDPPLATLGQGVWLGAAADRFAADLDRNRRMLAAGLDRCVDRLHRLHVQSQRDEAGT